MSNHEEDKLFKYATKEDGFSFINLIEEINWDIRKYDFKSKNLTFNPTELIELDPAIYKSDMIMELDSIIVMTEFQSTVVKKFDEKRYRLYTAIVDYAKQNNKPILLIVFSTAEKTKIKQYKLNKDCVFTIPIISLKDFDGDEIINNIEKKIKNKNIYIALVLTFILTGLGSVYAGNTKKGLTLLILRVLFAALAFFSNIFGILSVLVWVYGFYEVYNDVQIANRNSSPNLINDFKNWNQHSKIIAILIICVILILTLNSLISFSSTDSYSPGDSATSNHVSYSYDSYPSHYGGVDTSPDTIAKNDPDSYYDYYEYGDNPDVDDYLESEGYD